MNPKNAEGKAFVVQDLNTEDVPQRSEGPLKPESRRDMRSLAFHFIYAVDRSDYTVPLEEIVENFQKGFCLELPQDSLAVAMAQGTIAMREEADTLIKPLLRNWRLERLGCCTKLILRLALWELRQPDAIPSVIINEAIELAKCFAEKDAYKFINGILDELSKQLCPNAVQEAKNNSRGENCESTDKNQPNQADSDER